MLASSTNLGKVGRKAVLILDDVRKARVHAEVHPHIGQSLGNGGPQGLLAQRDQLLVDAPLLLRLLDGLLKVKRRHLALAGGNRYTVHAEMRTPVQLVGDLVKDHVLATGGEHAGQGLADVAHLLPGVFVQLRAAGDML